MTWTRKSDLTAQVQKLWDRGDLLRHELQPNDLFPFKLKLKKPNSTDLTDHFESAREWIGHINSLKNYRIEVREFTHRVLGKNSVPDSVWVDDLQSAIAILTKQPEVECFRILSKRLSGRLPELLPWMGAHAVRSLSFENDWEQLLDVTDWMKRNPRPNIYLRQVDLPGLHTKFIESNAGVLAEWFDIVLPADQVNQEMPVGTQFAARYGFKIKPIHIRFRLLDLMVWPAMRGSDADIAMDSASFASLDLKPRYIFITENEVNFLAFPSVPNSIIIFGKGYGWEALAKAEWMKKCSILYWGDIDTHGFAILDQLRQQLPHVTSFLMDRQTLMSHQSFWVKEIKQATYELNNLTSEELELYEALRGNTIAMNLRLEQERIDFSSVFSLLKSAKLDSYDFPVEP